MFDEDRNRHKGRVQLETNMRKLTEEQRNAELLDLGEGLENQLEWEQNVDTGDIPDNQRGMSALERAHTARSNHNRLQDSEFMDNQANFSNAISLRKDDPDFRWHMAGDYNPREYAARESNELRWTRQLLNEWADTH